MPLRGPQYRGRAAFYLLEIQKRLAPQHRPREEGDVIEGEFRELQDASVPQLKEGDATTVPEFLERGSPEYRERR